MKIEKIEQNLKEVKRTERGWREILYVLKIVGSEEIHFSNVAT